LYLAFTFAIALVFTNADRLELGKNKCEQLALEKISKSVDRVVLVENDCTVLSWRKITDPAQSNLNGQLLKKWQITVDSKQYYQRE
jgi:hypothetical protein